MKSSFTLLLLTLLFTGSYGAPVPARQAIRELMQFQQDAWNEGNIERFMEGYWKSDSLTFTGSAGITYGWNKTYERYKNNYNSREKMGKLTFTLLEMRPLGKKYYTVIGKWHLTRRIGDTGGHFTLLLRRFGRSWKIIADHTS